MKMTWIKILMIFAFAAVFTSCKDRNAEKRIAELESRLAELEGKKPVGPASATPTPATAAVKDEKPEGPLPKFEFQNVDHDFGRAGPPHPAGSP